MFSFHSLSILICCSSCLLLHLCYPFLLSFNPDIYRLYLINFESGRSFICPKNFCRKGKYFVPSNYYYNAKIWTSNPSWIRKNISHFIHVWATKCNLASSFSIKFLWICKLFDLNSCYYSPQISLLTLNHKNSWYLL